MITADQSDVIDFMADPAHYPHAVPAVERIETHAAIVFLAGDRAYKIKRAVRYDYLDFSTLEQRRAACEAELRINRRTAPDLYLEVAAVTRGPDGALGWGTSDAVEEWVLVMRRFPQEALFDRLAAQGRLDLALMEPLAEAVARFHADAERIQDHGGRAGMDWVITGNAAAFEEHAAILGAETCAAVTARCRALLDQHGDLLEARRLGGFVRRCHGDLHLRNLVLLDGRPTLFDAVEFNDEIACVDALYDIAFLVMDLLRRRLPAHANAVFNRYIACTGDMTGLAALPLFLGCRAAIRAKTSASAAALKTAAARADELGVMGREYVAMAERLLTPPAPMLIAIGGPSGSGKSTLAATLAPRIGAAPGALVLRSDVIRKSLFGSPLRSTLGADAYREEVSRRVYAVLAERAALALSAGHAVIADAVYVDAEARAGIAAVARREQVPFAGLWLEAAPAVMAERLDRRKNDVSDATAAVLHQQLRTLNRPADWHAVDAGGGPLETERRARLALQSIVQIDAAD